MKNMEKSKVYFTNMRAIGSESIPQKLRRLIKMAGIDEIDYKNKYTAVKIHFGELGNLAFLRPNYAKVVVDIIKENEGKAFLTDCNTLYVGSRKNALDHLDTAYLNGFSPFSTGCHVIIADGLKGTDESVVKINGEYCKEARIGRAVMDADILISLNHFKGHEGAGFGGALKNIGMGCGSRAGKMAMHNSGKPLVNADKCISCGDCIKFCAHSAIEIDNSSEINQDKCVGCGRCIGVCPVDAVYSKWDEASDILNKKIAEYSLAVLDGRPHFHISLVIDVSPNCDCHRENDVPIVPDVGMFASFDPVALDLACADAVNKQPRTPGSMMDDRGHQYNDHFKDLKPTTNWKALIEHSVKLGLGKDQYELIEMK